MKKLFILCLIMFSIPLFVFTQTEYKSEKYVGPQAYTANMRPNGKLVLKGPASDTLTDWQNIPFDFYFYGKKIDGYFISDDGYITFSKDKRHIPYNNKSLPNSEKPNNAIYGYWENLKLENVMTMWSNEIRTITLGEPPERFHVIMWISAVPNAETFSTAALSFAIVLMEKNNEINIVYVAGRKNNRLKGIIGIENEDGSKALMLENSPDFDFPSLTAIAGDDITYTISENTLTNEYNVTTNNKISVFPNPVKDYLTLKTSDNDYIKSLTLYSLDGSKVFEDNFINKITTTLNTNNLAKGYYLLEVELASFKRHLKLIIKN